MIKEYSNVFIKNNLTNYLKELSGFSNTPERSGELHELKVEGQLFIEQTLYNMIKCMFLVVIFKMTFRSAKEKFDDVVHALCIWCTN